MRKLSKIAVHRPVTFMMLAFIIIGFGLYGLSNLSLNLYPDVSFPTITVYTTYEGVAPEDMETLVTRPIEEQVGSVSGIQKIRSLSSQGSSVIKLHFSWGTDLYRAESDVRQKLDMVRRAIPDDAEQPTVFTYDPNQEPVVVLTMTSDTRSPQELRTIATQQVEQRLERIKGIASTETSGGYERQINIKMSNQAMRTYNIDMQAVANKLQQENIQVPAGQLTEGRTVYSLRTIGEYKNIDEIRNTIVSTSNDRTVFLKDIAEVEDGIAQPIGKVHVGNKDGLIINTYRQSDANVVGAANGVIEQLESIRDVLPAGVELDVLSNEAEFVQQSIRNLIMTGIQAVVLVVIILLAFLRNGRSAFIIAVSIPVSIIATFSIMDWSNLSLNIISLSGLTLAVGMVVDDAVVVLENIFSFREKGHEGKRASIEGAQEVAVPVVISTLTTLVVFLPVLFVPGIAGFLFRDLALTISFALVISSLVALSIIPVLSSKLFQSYGDRQSYLHRLMEWSHENMVRRIIASIPIVLAGILYLIQRGIHIVGQWLKSNVADHLGNFFDRLEQSYNNTLDHILKRSGLAVILAVVFFLVVLPVYNFLGGEFFPPVDDDKIVLDIQREPGVNLLELERTFNQVENIVQREVPEARLIVSEFGDKEGVEGADNPGGYQGKTRIELTPSSERERSEFQILSSLLNELSTVPGAEINEFRQDRLSPDGQTGLIVQILGYNSNQKRRLARGVKQQLQKIDGVINVFSSAEQGRPELRVSMDRERISRLGMTTSQVAQALSNAVKGNVATTFVDQGIEHEILVQLDPREKAQTTNLRQLQIQTPDGQWMPLQNLATIERYQGPSNILRLDQERAVEVKADLSGIDLRQASERARARLSQINWPEGYRYQMGGTAEDQQDSFYYLIIAFVIAGILTYMVMASQFESLMEPFIILITIPLALTGVLLILWITSTPISVTSMVGLILLSGIVVNNGIVMIDYIKILQVRNYTRHQAIREGATRRLRPILITAFTTILCMIPLALEIGAGSETWSPMARTVIGGLTMSTLLMLFVVPCLYNLVNSMVEKLGFDAIHKLDPLIEGQAQSEEAGEPDNRYRQDQND